MNSKTEDNPYAAIVARHSNIRRDGSGFLLLGWYSVRFNLMSSEYLGS